MLRAVIVGIVERGGATSSSSSPCSSSLRLLARSLSTASSCSGYHGLHRDVKGETVRAPAATTRGPSMMMMLSSSFSPSLPSTKNLVVEKRRRVSFLASSAAGASSPPSLSLSSRSFAADAATSLDNNPALSSSSSPSPSSKKKSKVVPIPLAQTGEGIKECELVSWRVSEGDAVDEFGPLCEVQSDKAAVEITSRYAGVVERLCFAEGDVVEVGATLCELRVELEEEEEGEDDEIDVGAGSSSSSAAAAPSSPFPSVPSPSKPPECPSVSLASPAVRRVARELGLADLSAVVGTGPAGRILKSDVERHVAGSGGVSSSAAAPARPTPPLPPPPPPQAPSSSTTQQQWPQSQSQQPTLLSPKDVVIPLRGYRRAMVAAMESSLAVPHFHFMDEYDVGSLLEARRVLAADKRLLDSGVKLTLLPFVVKAISLALSMTTTTAAAAAAAAATSAPPPPPPSGGGKEERRLHALVNASLSATGDAVVAHDDHNVGVAVDTPRGLVVPVVRRVQDLSVADVAAELARLQRGLSESHGILPEADLRGATITVSNIGSLGGAWATPLVHPPQAAIVALGRVRPRLVVVDDNEVNGGAASEREKKKARGDKKKNNINSSSPPHQQPPPSRPTLGAVPSLPMSWGADHRVVDGAGLARFAADVGALLSEPARMLLHSR